MIRRLLAVAAKEALLLLRDPQLLVVQTTYPVLALLVFGYVLTITVTAVPVAVHDRDGSAESRRAVRELLSTSHFARVEATDTAETTDTAEAALDRGAALVVVDVPPGFARNLRSGRPAEVNVRLDGSDVVAARAAQAYLDRFEREQRAAHGVAQPPDVDASLVTWFNPELRDPDFFIPGVIAVILFCSPAILTSLSLGRERTSGTFQALGATPVGDLELLAGKLLPHFLQAALAAATVLLVARLAFDLPVRGSLALLAAGTAPFILTQVGLGAIFSSLSRDEEETWAYLGRYVIVPAFILSGFIYPISSMPAAGRAASALFPIRHYLELLRGVLLKDASAADLATPLAVLVAFALATQALAVHLVRRSRRAAS